MAFVKDVKLTTTLFGPVSLMDGEKTGVGKHIAKFLKPTVTIESDFFGSHAIAPWGEAKPIPKETVLIALAGLFLLIRR